MLKIVVSTRNGSATNISATRTSRQLSSRLFSSPFIRRNGVVYAEIVNDVLDHFGCSYKKDDVVESKELKILEKLLAQAWERMSAEERSEIQSSLGIPIGAGPATLAAIQTAIKLGGVASYRASLFAANALARSLVGRGLAIGANTTLTRTLGILGGPIGWAVTAIWTAYDFASPAYRITVPCVIQIAYMRQKKSRSVCHACSAINALSSKFCAECGAKLEHGTKNEPKGDA